MFFLKNKQQQIDKSTLVDRKTIASIAPSLMVNNWNHLIVNDNYVRMLVVDSWPNFLDINWAEPFMGLAGLNVPVTLKLIKRDNATIRKQLNLTATESNRWDSARIAETELDREKRDYQSEQANKAARMIVRDNAQVFEMYLYSKISGSDQSELSNNTSTALDHIRSYSLCATQQNANQLHMFWAASPFMCEDTVSESRYNFSAPSITIARGLWNRDIGICDDTGIPLGIDDTGGLVRLNPMVNTTYRPNGNILVVGETGSGKSTLLKILITYLSALYDCKIIINDVDGEYTKLAQELGGVVTYVGTDSMLISPFEPRNLASNVEATDAPADDNEVEFARAQAMSAPVLQTHLPFLTEYLLQSFQLNRQRYKDLIYTACNIAYNNFGISNEMTFGEFYQSKKAYPSLRDVYDALAEVRRKKPELSQDIDSLAFTLERAVNGPEKKMWKKSEQTIPDSPVVCINLQSLSSDEDALAAQYYNLLTWQWTQIAANRYKNEKVIIVSDELQTSFTSKNLDFCIRYATMIGRVRKYGGMMISSLLSATALDQAGVESLGRQVSACSAYKFIGTTSEPKNKVVVQKLLNTTDEVIDDLSRAKQGRFVLQAGVDQECWLNVELKDWMKDLFGRGGGK